MDKNLAKFSILFLALLSLTFMITTYAYKQESEKYKEELRQEKIKVGMYQESIKSYHDRIILDAE